ncbi:D-alanyl-D-alanine endopeptidase [Bordetella genomosp. 1]|nr:D-alanyl-D-alanine endopeptidase [Bordetella genomosp. 1]MDQ8032538.1 D-alanyl-D-alanine endopeptidase [Bordetella sp.]
MAFPWMRAISTALAPLALAAAALLPLTAQAAAAKDPCKTNAKSSACKAAQSKKKTTAAKPASKSSSKSSAKTGSKSAPAKSASAGKNTNTTKIKASTRKKAAATAAAGDAAMPPLASSPAAEARALRSTTAYVQDLETSTVMFAKNENVVRPIASISKLMTALVVVDANLPMDEVIEVTDDDVDTLKHTTSRLRVGTRLTRGDMLHLALMSSENRAAHALGRNYPGGLNAFVTAMNAKARSLGMLSTHFIEPTGLSSENVSSPHDLARLLRAAAQRPLIHRYSTDTEYDVEINNRTQTFRNTNLLVRKPDWDIKVSKTGFINEAGECLVMLARINGRDVAIVLLDSQGKLSRIGDAVRIRRILQSDVAML